ncbi:unnamed protein product [Arctia plantaginis]|uniref:Uncharacterized protein n=1 Tax=Arctia plantaginis TaxID=874455 RepID=A0A8S0YXA1_ARCPL|nr:unnamed protein product [Arctia plantaginis]CAB3242214.1 unnamed protein product [Arctia plantaginis]
MDVVITVPFPSTDLLQLAYDVLNVDKEYKIVSRDLRIKESYLVVKFFSEDPKKLRMSVHAFNKNLRLILKTVNQFAKKPV